MGDHDPRISPREDWTEFRIHRIDDTVVPISVGDPLVALVDGVERDRFPARDLRASTILERWEAGRYCCHLYAVDGGNTSYRGRTHSFLVDELGGVQRITPPSRRKKHEGSTVRVPDSPEVRRVEPRAVRSIPAPPRSVPLEVAPPPPVGAGDPMVLFQWLESMRASERQRADEVIERERVRVHTDAELTISRERQAGERMLAQQGQFYERMTALDKRAATSQAPELAEVIRRLDEVQDALDDADEAGKLPTAQTSELVQVMQGLSEMLKPIMPAIVDKYLLNGGPSAGKTS